MMMTQPAPSPLQNAAPAGFLLLVALMTIFAAAKPIQYDTMDPDCFWHLRVAEQLQRDGIGPIVDDISFASIREPWTPYSWLAELGMKRMFDFGGFRVALLFQAVVQATLMLLIVKSCVDFTRGRDGSYFSIVIASAFGIFLCMPYLSFRPVTFAIMLLALCAWLMLRDRTFDERTRAVWWIVPITVLLANVHLFVFFVPLWSFAMLAGAIVERYRGIGNSRRIARYSLMTFLTAAASCCTPMLPGVIKTAIYYRRNDPMVASGMIAEMQSITNGTSGKIAVLLLSVFAFFMIKNFRKIRAGEWFCVLGVGLCLSWITRFSPIFAIISAPCFAATLPKFSGKVLTRKPIVVVLTIVIAAAIFQVVTNFPTAEMPFDKWLNRNQLDGNGYPTGAANFVQQNVDAKFGRLVTDFNNGGFIAWRLGNRFKVLMDGRTQVYSPEFWKAVYLGSLDDRMKFLAGVHADAAIVPSEMTRMRQALENIGWKVIYEDKVGVVLLPPENFPATLPATAPTSSPHTERGIPAPDSASSEILAAACARR